MPSVTNLCCLLTCPNRYAVNINAKKHSLFRFPKDRQRCEVWLKYCGREDLKHLSPEELHRKNYRVCSLHFAGEMFAGVRLKKFAFPTIKGGEAISLDEEAVCLVEEAMCSAPEAVAHLQESSGKEIGSEKTVLNNPGIFAIGPPLISSQESFNCSINANSSTVSLPMVSPLEECDYWLRIP
ncbi:uncharacterized protein LOC108911856 [Anoplophora glabripennis]|uniref:uncharacterized protein LOC108911856 n=1 Tax=Anoplophora glabripennis TaxID=217634 RepID=UPI000873D469|nr:uncharacterized protein LOC108911856 [Anoplophora glabripennis]